VVKIANIAQIVNVIAPVLTRGDDMLVQSIFYPFEMVSRRRDGVALRVIVDGPTYESTHYGSVGYVDATAIMDGCKLKVFLTNRSANESGTVAIRMADGAILSAECADILTGPDPKATNSFEHRDIVTVRPLETVHIKEGQASAQLSPLSFTAMTLNIE